MGGAEGGADAEAGVPRADVSVCGGVPEARRKRRQIGSRKVRVVRKLDESKLARIVRQKADGAMTNRQIAEAMGARTRWVQARWARYKHQRPADVQFPMPMGRPPGGLPGRREYGAVAGLHAQRRAGGGGHPGALVVEPVVIYP